MPHLVYSLVDGLEVRYVGYSARPEYRRRTHLRKHPDWHWIVLGVYATREGGLQNERWWIKKLRERGYSLVNVLDGGSATPIGRSMSDITKAKMRAANLGKKHSPETRAKIGANNAMRLSAEARAKNSAAHIGKRLSHESLAKLSAALKGRAFSPEHRAALSAALQGKATRGIGWHHSPKTKAKMSLAAMGRPKSLEHRAHLSAARRGKPWTDAQRAAIPAGLKGHKGCTHTPEFRARRSAAMKDRWKDPAYRASQSVAHKAKKRP